MVEAAMVVEAAVAAVPAAMAVATAKEMVVLATAPEAAEAVVPAVVACMVAEVVGGPGVVVGLEALVVAQRALETAVGVGTEPVEGGNFQIQSKIDTPERRQAGTRGSISDMLCSHSRLQEQLSRCCSTKMVEMVVATAGRREAMVVMAEAVLVEAETVAATHTKA